MNELNIHMTSICGYALRFPLLVLWWLSSLRMGCCLLLGLTQQLWLLLLFLLPLLALVVVQVSGTSGKECQEAHYIRFCSAAPVLLA